MNPSFPANRTNARATLVSLKPKNNPFAAGDFETAWVQPLVAP
jgi:hypothetical protein